MDNKRMALIMRTDSVKPIDWPIDTDWEPHAYLESTTFSKVKCGDIFQLIEKTDNSIVKLSDIHTGYVYWVANSEPYSVINENNVPIVTIDATPIPTPEPMKFWYGLTPTSLPATMKSEV